MRYGSVLFTHKNKASLLASRTNLIMYIYLYYKSLNHKNSQKIGFTPGPKIPDQLFNVKQIDEEIN